MQIKTAAEQIAEILRDYIFSGTLSPGAKLREVEVSKMLNVSRTPIREAFRILESDGLVEVSSNRGVQIPLIPPRDTEEVCEFRQLVESYCIRKFITLLDENHLQEMEGIVRHTEEALDQSDYTSYYAHSIAFHSYYISKCQNDRLYAAFTRIRNSMRCSQMILDKDLGFLRASVNKHKEIIEALRERDSDKSERIMMDHLVTNCQMMKRNLEGNTRLQAEIEI